jgi:hypothetical protein
MITVERMKAVPLSIIMYVMTGELVFLKVKGMYVAHHIEAKEFASQMKGETYRAFMVRVFLLSVEAEKATSSSSTSEDRLNTAMKYYKDRFWHKELNTYLVEYSFRGERQKPLLVDAASIAELARMFLTEYESHEFLSIVKQEKESG